MEHVLEYILLNALKKEASDIHLTTQSSNVSLTLRIKENLIFQQNFSLEEGMKLINYIKYLSHIDLNFRLLPSTGQFSYFLQQRKYDFRVSSIPTLQGDHIVVRILHLGKRLSLEELTPQSKAIDYFEHLLAYDAGLIVIGGPTGEGKSTTLHALLKSWYQKKQVNIITIEDPIEIIVPEFTQVQVNFNAGIDFDNSLKQILRHDPDIVMIGEIRDEISAALALRCALTGCLVVATIHAKNCKGAFSRLVNLNITTEELQEVMISILSQRLVYQNHQPTYAFFEWMNVKQLMSLSHDVNNFETNIKEAIALEEVKLDDIKKSKLKSFLFDD